MEYHKAIEQSTVDILFVDKHVASRFIKVTADSGDSPAAIELSNPKAFEAALALVEATGVKPGVPFGVTTAEQAEQTAVYWLARAVEMRREEEVERVKKYFKEVRQLELKTVLEMHREEYRRAEEFSKEVFGRRPKVISYEDRMKADPYVKWRTKEVGPIHFVFEYDHNAGRWDCTASAYGSKQEPYDGTLSNISHSYFPLEEVLD